MSCKYSDFFGKVGKGIHNYRLFNLAIVDVIMTIIGAYFLNILFFKTNYYLVLLGFFISGIILHRIFCVRTTIDRFLFT